MSAEAGPSGTKNPAKAKLSMTKSAVRARKRLEKMSPFQTLRTLTKDTQVIEERIKRKYQKRVYRHDKTNATAAAKAGFRAEAIKERDAEIEEERAKWAKRSVSSSDSSESSSSDDEPDVPPAGLPTIPDNELAIMKQIEALQAQLKVAQTANKAKGKEAVDELNAAADGLIYERQANMLAKRRATRSTAKPVKPTPDDGDDGDDEGGDDDEPPPPKKARLDKGKGKAVEEAPLLPLIVLTREQYANLKVLVRSSIGMKKIPSYDAEGGEPSTLKVDTRWDRLEARCRRRNAYNHNGRLWKGWKRKHMMLLEIGVRILTRQGRAREVDTFISENAERLKRCMIGLYSGYTSRLQGLDALGIGEAPDHLWNLPIDVNERALQRKEFEAYEAALARRTAAAKEAAAAAPAAPAGPVIHDLSDDDVRDSETEDQDADNEYSDDGEDIEDRVIRLGKLGDAEWLDGAAVEQDESDSEDESDDMGVEEDLPSGPEELSDSSDDVDSDASHTTGFSSDDDGAPGPAPP